MLLRLTLFICGLLAACPVDGQPPESRQKVALQGIAFDLPSGWTIEKVASDPLVRWPIVADFDPTGRLVVAESGGVGWPIQEHNQKKLHRIVRLVDQDGDGTFDDRIVAADQLAFPEGVLCLGNDIFVSAPPVIWRLTDDDADGVCERREVWFDAKTVTNCANDLHGPYLGRDGWIYWCKGAFGEQTHALLDGRSWTSSAAHIYRRHPSGGKIEPVTSGGMDNPVEVAITPEGDKFFTSTFLQHPGDGKRDGIGHAVYGAVFGKDHRVVESMWHTGPLMKPMTHLGPAAPSGLICLESPALKQSLGFDRDERVLAAALFNLHKLTLHQLHPSGSTYRTVDFDLVRTEQVDFHPTDVIEDGDGSLLLLDTGGWYDLCCPTSRVDQKTAAGGIYRITPTQHVTRTKSPKSNRMVEGLFDSRSWKRRVAASELVGQGDTVISDLVGIASDSGRALDQRQEAVWALCRLESNRADAAVSELLSISLPRIQLTCLQVLALHRYEPCRAQVESLLQHESPQLQRVAAMTLGRIGNWASAESLLSAVEASEGDRQLQHARRYALMEIAFRNPDRSLVSLADSDSELNAALQAHSQLEREIDMEPSRLFTALRSPDSELRNTATSVLARRPDIASSAIDELKQLWNRVASDDPSPGEVLAPLLEAWKTQPEVTSRVWHAVHAGTKLDERQQTFLATHLTNITVQPLNAEQSTALLEWTEAANETIRDQLLDRIAEAAWDDESRALVAARLIEYAVAADTTAETLHWLEAIPGGTALAGSELQSAVVESLLQDDPSLNVLAANVSSRVRLDSEFAARIADSIDSLNSKYLSVAIEAVARSGDETAITLLMERLPTVPAARMLRDGYLVNLFRQSPASTRARVEAVAAMITRPPADVQATVDRVLAELKPGDPVRGLQVFRSSKAACSACHQMGYIGKNIGPELTRIGSSRTRAALLEAILFPSSRIEQSYQSTQVLTEDGRILNGLVRQRSAQGLELQVEAERVVKLRNDEIASEQPSEVSVMPSGLNDVLSMQDLADLIALLENAT